MKPMLKYRGGKTKEIPHIMCHVPRFSGRYVEPFFGGGALFFYLEPREAIINDINSKLMTFYRGVRNDFTALRLELDEIEKIYKENRLEFDRLKSIHPNERVEDKNEAFYYRLRAMFNDIAPKEYSDALLYFYINKTAYSGMIRYNAKGEFNVPFGRYANLNTSGVTLSHSKLLQRSEVCNSDYSEIFEKCQSDDFVFLDPPYDCVFSDYGNVQYKDGFTEDSHKQLAQDFKNLPCKALMVIGRTPLTEELYRSHIVDEYDKSYAVNIRNRFKSEAKHIVVANYRMDERDEERSFIQNYTTYPMPETAHVMLFEKGKDYGKNK